MKDSLNIAIAGATGYIGLELIKILIKHPRVKILYICASKSVGKSISTFDRKLKSKKLSFLFIKLGNIAKTFFPKLLCVIL